MIISNKFRVVRKITTNVFHGENIITDEQVFIKVQPKNIQISNLLKNEAIILNYIKSREGFPTIKYYSSDSENYYLILSLLDKTLSQLKSQHYNHNQTGSPLSINMILNFGIQIIERVCYFHQTLKLLHRDIKPDNIMTGFKDKSSIAHLIDFGFAKKYIEMDENNIETHIHLRKNKDFIGTRNFASLNVLNGIECSRRDDLESVLYTLMYMYLSDNDWEWLNVDLNEKEDRIYLLYEKTLLPKVFIDLFKHIRSIEYECEPEYDFIVNLMESCCENNI